MNIETSTFSFIEDTVQLLSFAHPLIIVKAADIEAPCNTPPKIYAQHLIVPPYPMETKASNKWHPVQKVSR